MPDLEVAYDRHRRLWVVRPFRRVDEPLTGKTFALYRRKADAVKVAAGIARVFADQYGSCEVFTRRKNGTLGDRSTYGRDPIESAG